MPPEVQNFVVRTTLSSPFGRKVRMAAHVLGLAQQLTLVPADVTDGDDSLRRQNPLGKIPCLVGADGTAVYDSGVIVEYLQEVSGSDRLLPASGPHRVQMLVLATLADGIIDAGATIIYEERYHKPGNTSDDWLAHQRGKIVRALAAFEARPPDPAHTDVVTIGLSCALGFLDKRRIIEWRGAYPRLCSWLDDFSAREPAFRLTHPPET